MLTKTRGESRRAGWTFLTMHRAHQILRGFVPLAVVLGLWSSFFWPLPLRMGRAIPFTAHQVGTVETQSLVPGDHLQLLYHFWLTRDMLAGGTPPFHNLYEFNTGVDSERRVLDPGYVPFSLVYAALSPCFGNAFGWNAVQFAAVFVAFLFLNRLARRYTDRPGLAVVAAALAMCVPYQWVTLAGGSPTGFGMGLVPAVALGLDIAVRDGRRSGGVLAGAALLLCYTSDLHSFFFGALLVPAWCVVAWVARGGSLWPTRRELGSLVRALWPTALAGAAAVGIAGWLQAQYHGTDVAGGRTVSELIANSPSRRALLGGVLNGADLHFRVGAVLLLLVVLAVGVALWRAVVARGGRGTKGSGRRALVAVLIALGVLALLALALGMSAPMEGLPLRAARKVLPPYRMIRQPVKILLLLPTLLAPLFAIGLGALWGTDGGRRLRRFTCGAVAAAILVGAAGQTAARLRLGLCALPPPNGAYQAVEAEARAAGRAPHVLALPLWPGDSAWSSLYEYRAMQGRVRMLNGYSPVRADTYFAGVFQRFESLTQGRLTAEQADALQAMGVTAILLHEDFPDVVSPFPVGATLRRLLAHPRLDLLRQDGSVWAFTLRGTDRAVASGAESADMLLPPARSWRWDESSPNGTLPATVKAALRSPVADWPAARWLIRTRGDGKARVERGVREAGAETPVVDEISVENAMFLARHVSGAALPTATLAHRAPGGAEGPVRWIELPLGALPQGGWATPAVKIATEEGNLRVLDVLLAGGQTSFGKGPLRLPAVDLFRGGKIEVAAGRPQGVWFRPTHDSAGEVLYGPQLPLPPGHWRVTSDGLFGGADAGLLRVLLGTREVARGAVGDGAPPVAFANDTMAPLTLRFQYGGKAEVRFDALVLEWVAEQGAP